MGIEIGLAFGTIAIGLAVVVLTFIFTTHQSFNVFLMFGGIATIICGLIAIMDIRARIKGTKPNDLGARRQFLVLVTPIFLWSIAMLFGAAIGANDPDTGLDLTFVVEMFGVVCFMGWLTLRLLQPVDPVRR